MNDLPQSRPLSCDEARERLPLFVGRDLMSADTAAVEVHLASCLDCFRQSRALEGSQAFLRAAAQERPAMPAAAGFLEDVMGQIHGPPPVARRWVSRTVALSGWAAALVLGFLLWAQDPGADDLGRRPSLERGPAAVTLTSYERSGPDAGAVEAEGGVPGAGLPADSALADSAGSEPGELDGTLDQRYLAVNDF